MLSVLCAYLLAFSSQAQPSFSFVGSMDSLLVSGKTAGPVSNGLPFQIVLSESGTKLSGTEFNLTPHGTDKTLKLSFPGLTYASGDLKGAAEINNSVGSSIQGVRVDITSAIETYKAKDDQGKDVEKTRTVSIVAPSPLYFGDLADGESNGQIPFNLDGLKFNPATISIKVNGVVSGVRFDRSFTVPTVAADGQIDIDNKDRIYLSSTADDCVARIDNDGKNLVELCKLPDQCKGMAVNPVTGEIAANCGNHSTIYFFDANGTMTGSLADGVLDGYSDFQRYDLKGHLWTNVGSAYWGFDTSHKVTARVQKFGDFDITGGRFDVEPDGTMFSATEDSILYRKPDGTGGIFAKGNGDKLGQLFGVISVRYAPDGLVYVVENGANNVTLGTITVFTPSGSVVRAFGRGAKKAMDNFPDGIWPSQLFNPSDIAFGRDGRIYVNSQNREDNGPKIMIYVPF